MYYIKLSNPKSICFIGDIWLNHPELNGQYVCPETYAKVEAIPQPEHDYATQIAKLDAPIQENGKWIMTWKVVDYTQSELDAMAQAQAELEAQQNQE
jgi:hypothetical protein